MTGTSFDLSGRSGGGKSAKKCLLFGGGSYCCHYLMIQATLQSSSLVVSIIQSHACQVIAASAAEPSEQSTRPSVPQSPTS